MPSASARPGEHRVEAGDARVGDEGLDPGEALEAAVLLRAGARASQVGPGLGLGHGEGREALARRTAGSQRPFCTSVPAR